jgi:hypothetical protein
VCLDLLEKARSIRPCGRILRLGSAGRVKTAACGWARRACRRVKTKRRSPSALFTDHKGTNTNTDPSAKDKAVIAQIYPRCASGLKKENQTKFLATQENKQATSKEK